MPRFSDDDVMNFKVTEAVIAHAREIAQEAEEKAAKKREEDAWKRNAATLPDG